MRIAVYPGSFDPCTMGHFDIIKRAGKMFDKLIVAVLTNSSKNAVFSVDERVEMIKLITRDISGVEVESFSGLLVDFMKYTGAGYIVKGLRAVSDFEYEFQMAIMNRELNQNIETLLLPASPQYMFLSSSIVKEVGKHGGSIVDLVPGELAPMIIERLHRGKLL